MAFNFPAVPPPPQKKKTPCLSDKEDCTPNSEDDPPIPTPPPPRTSHQLPPLSCNATPRRQANGRPPHLAIANHNGSCDLEAVREKFWGEVSEFTLMIMLSTINYTHVVLTLLYLIRK